MILSVFGATGRTGRVVVAQALAGGHRVRALVRAPNRARFPPDVDIVRGDVRSSSAVDRVVEGAGAIISCLGATLSQTFRAEGRVNAYGMPHIVASMRTHGARRIIAMSSYGAGDSLSRMGAVARFGMATVMRGVLADMNALEETLLATDLDWTILRPVNLEDGPMAGRLTVDRPGAIGARQWVRRADVAAFMLAALEDPSTFRRVLLLSR